MIKKPFLEALKGHVADHPPFWLMRQAGRYLPEYRQLRASAGGFLDLCLDPIKACEITLQPLRRYDMDAAILFSDILIVPFALGQSLQFLEGEGPCLDPVRSADDLSRLRLEGLLATAQPVFEAVSRIKASLAPEKTLIGFAGSPWTVACYMVEGGGSKEYAHVKGFAYRDPQGFKALLELLSHATIDYLCAQIDAGAEAIQLFDSWAGIVSADDFEDFVIKPTVSIVSALKARHPHIPIIGFPRMASLGLADYLRATQINGLSLDPGVPLSWAKEHLQAPMLHKGLSVTLQGNLDPCLLLAGGAVMRRAVEKILTVMQGVPFIFNLGHGVIKETPPSHVAQLAALIRGQESHDA
jgi:uroporphyrinogen decarboxylase